MLDRIYIEISNICNVQCSFCPVVERDKKIMSLEDFEDIIVQVAPMCKQVCLHLMGEPLAHPHFEQILELCEKYGAKVQVTTNGLLLRKFERILIESKALRQINFSLQAYVDNFPHKELEGYLKPILEFCEKLNSNRPEVFVNLRLWNQDSFDGDNTEIFDFVDAYFNIKLNRNIQVEAIKSKRIWNKVYLHFDSRFEWPSMELEYQGDQGRCNGVVSHVGIQADGVVVPCCLDKEAIIKLGNIKKDSLKAILSNERTTAMRDGFNSGKLVEKLCQHCTYINRFKK